MLSSKRGNQICAVVALLLFIALQYFVTYNNDHIKNIVKPPQDQALLDFNFNEPLLLARAIMLGLQTFDTQSGNIIHFHQLDYEHLIAWLQLVNRLNPKSQYPLLSASHIFVESKKPQHVRKILLYIQGIFERNPQQFWRWQAHSVLIAKHTLADTDLALQLSRKLNQLTEHGQIDYWAQDLEFLLLEDVGEFESAVFMIQGLLDAGHITDARELQFLTHKLTMLQKQQKR